MYEHEIITPKLLTFFLDFPHPTFGPELTTFPRIPILARNEETMGETIVLTPEMICVMAILAFTIYLFVSELVPVDVAAISIMVILGLTGLFAPMLGLSPLVNPDELFSGFASNAVISIMAVMILGAGLDKTGVIARIASLILRVGGHTEAAIIPIVCGTVGIISSFFQNVGSAALFLPVISRISRRTGIPLSRLLMPMGFCAILGGTVTMVGSSPLILLNDLILNSNKVLPEGIAPMQAFSLFEVTPIGLVLVGVGIAYFVLAGRLVLPATISMAGKGSTYEYFHDLYGVEGSVFEALVPEESPLVGKNVHFCEEGCDNRIYVVGIKTGDRMGVDPTGDVIFHAGTVVALMGNEGEVEKCAGKFKLVPRRRLKVFADALAPTNVGLSEIVIPPRSDFIGRRLTDIRIRRSFGLKIVAIHRGNQNYTYKRGFVLQQGDTLVVHSRWQNLAKVQEFKNRMWVITDYPHQDARPHKVVHAFFFFLVSLCLVLFTDLRLSISLLTGAVGMIVTGVLTVEQAYRAISWKTVFLLASLIPLGLAVETTGTAAWIAQNVLKVMDGVPGWFLQAAVAALATFFTLVMSNVGATVLLVPIAINIAIGAGENPAVFALTVGIATSNSFIIPTHQVNALIMGPAGYRVKDFMRAGGVMTILFLVVSMFMLRLVF